jgi:hypothetical protein
MLLKPMFWNKISASAMKSWYILLWFTSSYILSPFQNTYAQFYVQPEQINKYAYFQICWEIIVQVVRCRYILLWKHHQTLNIFWVLIASIVTFPMTTYKFVFLDNFFFCNCRSSVRMRLKRKDLKWCEILSMILAL